MYRLRKTLCKLGKLNLLVESSCQFILYAKFKFYCYRHQLQTALRPLMETYSITASCLPKILDSEDGILESDFVKLVLRKITLRLTSGECQYGNDAFIVIVNYRMGYFINYCILFIQVKHCRAMLLKIA